MYEWQVSEGRDGKLVAKLLGTKVVVSQAADRDPEPWAWEVHFADGQVQVGYAADADAALERGKEVAERFLP